MFLKILLKVENSSIFDTMKADIININYFNETKFYKILRIIVIFFAVCFGVYSGIDWFITPLDNYENYYYLFMQIFLGLVFLINILESILFTRIGTFEVSENMLVITNRETVNHIDLTTVNEVTIGKVAYRFYKLKINQDNIVINFTKMEIRAFSKLLESFNIKINRRIF